jgi:serine/threonine-protein phosphatase 2A activator
MIKMYLAEVLGKLPVVQHFLFGTLLPYTGPPPPASAETVDPNDPHYGHAHSHDQGAAGQREVGWGDCCGIPVPSAFGAAQAEKTQGLTSLRISGPGIRPVPFD